MRPYCYDSDHIIVVKYSNLHKAAVSTEFSFRIIKRRSIDARTKSMKWIIRLCLTIIITYWRLSHVYFAFQSGTTHMVFFSAPGPLADVRRWNVTGQDVIMQRVQLLKSQLPDPEFPPDTKSFVMHVDDVRTVCLRKVRSAPFPPSCTIVACIMLEFNIMKAIT